MGFSKYVYGKLFASFLLIMMLDGCRNNDVLLSIEDEMRVPIHRSFERELIYRGIDDVEDGHVLYRNIRDIETLALSGGQSKNIITSLSGIEYFKNLRSLTIALVSIDSLNLSKNAELTYLFCYTKHISSSQKSLRYLNVNGCEKLRDLFCRDNDLEILEIGSNKDLTSLDCSNNNLKVLDTSSNSRLRSLSCSNNPLRKLSLNRNIELENLECQRTQLTALDISMLPNLYSLNCYQSPVTNLELKRNLSLDSMNIQRTNLKSIDFGQIPNLTNLTIGAEYGGWTDPLMLRFDALKKLRILNCSNLKVDGLDFSQNQALEALQIEYSQMSRLELGQNERLSHLELWVVGELTYLDVRRCKNLEFCKINGCLDLLSVCVDIIPDLTKGKWVVENISILKLCK